MATEIQIGARQIAVKNPATGEALREFVCASPAEVSEAGSRARRCATGLGTNFIEKTAVNGQTIPATAQRAQTADRARHYF